MSNCPSKQNVLDIVAGNSLSIWAVVRYERLQTCTNYLICSLAVSDLVASVMVPLIMVYELHPDSWLFIPTCLFHQVSVVRQYYIATLHTTCCVFTTIIAPLKLLL